MKEKNVSLIEFMKNHGGMARFSSILKAGFHSDSLSALEKEGKVEKIGRGLYKLSNMKPAEYPDLIAVALQVPRGVICLLSALAFHEATDEIPKSIDVAIPRGSRANKIQYPPVRFYRFSAPVWEAGIETHEIGGRKIKVYSLAKTVADCFKFRNQIGMDVVRDALKTAWHEKNVKTEEMIRYAKICRVDSVMKTVMENLL